MDVVEQLGELLREAGFAGERSSVLAGMPGGVPPPEVLEAVDRPEDARLATLLKLFHHDETVARAAAEQALRPLKIEDILEAGLVETDGADARSPMKLSTFDGLIVAGDPIRGDNRGVSSVVNLSDVSIAVSGLTVRREGETALDLGTGSGVQALLAARHADRVVGLDVNPHALSFARLGQRLNGVENVRWLEGDWLEPVRGQRFDLVVATPPVAISPDNVLLYRDSPIGGEALSRQLVRECAEHLADGGFATVFCNWTHAEGAWEESPREWVADLGCDALILNLGSHEAMVYAMNHVNDRPGLDPETVTPTVNRWVEHFGREGVGQIATGVIVLRRRPSGPNWTRAFKTDRLPRGAAGTQLERMFAGADFLSSNSGLEQLRELMMSPWQLVEGHRLDQGLVYENGAYKGQAVLAQGWMNLYARVDPRVVSVVAGCDGQRPLAAVLREAPTPDGLERGQFQELCLSTIRDLIARGFLVKDGA